MEENGSKNVINIARSWAVHVFTSLGIVAGFLSLLAINNHDWPQAMFWLIIALGIDGVDGSLARYFEVKKHLAFVDGKKHRLCSGFCQLCLCSCLYVL